MKAAAVQTRPVFGDRAGNLARALKQMGSLKADLYVLPELFSTGYLFTSRRELKALSEPVGGDTVEALVGFSRDGGCAVFAGFAEAEGERLYNSSVLAVKGEVAAVYRKIHLFDEEKKLFDVTDNPPQVIEALGTRLGLMICFDWVFPELSRTLALKNARIFCHASNLVLPFCQRAMITRSLENGVFTVLANRVGEESRGGRELAFTGGSEIVDPRGVVLAEASLDAEEVIVASLDLTRAGDKKMTPGNHLFKDRRPDLYDLGPWPGE